MSRLRPADFGGQARLRSSSYGGQGRLSAQLLCLAVSGFLLAVLVGAIGAAP